MAAPGASAANPPGRTLEKYRTLPLPGSGSGNGLASSAALLTSQPTFAGARQPPGSRRVTYMSAPPQPPARVLTKNSVWSLRSIVGQKSFAGELTGAPRFSGAPHGASALSRRATQMSMPPSPPGRFDAMYSVRSSRAMNGQPSSAGPLNAGSVPGWDSTRVAGDQSENPLGMATAVAAMPPAATSATATLTKNFMSDHL